MFYHWLGLASRTSSAFHLRRCSSAISIAAIINACTHTWVRCSVRPDDAAFSLVSPVAPEMVLARFQLLASTAFPPWFVS